MARVIGCDIESTLTIEEFFIRIGGNRSLEIQQKMKEITNAAMSGEISFKESVHKRWELLKPTPKELKSMSQAYIDGLFPDAKELVQFAQENADEVVLISGGFRELFLPLAEVLGIDPANLYALPLENGRPPARHELLDDHEKWQILQRITDKVRRKLGRAQQIMIGDGMTDMRATDAGESEDICVAIGNRSSVLEVADLHVSSLSDAVVALDGRFEAARNGDLLVGHVGRYAQIKNRSLLPRELLNAIVTEENLDSIFDKISKARFKMECEIEKEAHSKGYLCAVYLEKFPNYSNVKLFYAFNELAYSFKGIARDMLYRKTMYTAA